MPRAYPRRLAHFPRPASPRRYGERPPSDALCAAPSVAAAPICVMPAIAPIMPCAADIFFCIFFISFCCFLKCFLPSSEDELLLDEELDELELRPRYILGG
jgi:hypothetical protein